MIEFEINTHRYKTFKMDVFVQWAVARRLAPVISGIMTPDLLKKFIAFSQIKPTTDGANSNSDAMLDLFSGVLTPFIEAISKMSDADSQYVIDQCLSVTQRNQNGGWATVKPINSGLMFQDIDMIEMMMIVMRVIVDNVGNFSFASLSNLIPLAPEIASQ